MFLFLKNLVFKSNIKIMLYIKGNIPNGFYCF